MLTSVTHIKHFITKTHCGLWNHKSWHKTAFSVSCNVLKNSPSVIKLIMSDDYDRCTTASNNILQIIWNCVTIIGTTPQKVLIMIKLNTKIETDS